MSLSEKQWSFLKDVAKMIQWADSQGYKLTGGELMRPMAMQYLYYFGWAIRLRDGIISLI